MLKMQRVYWFFVAAIVAAAVHLSYVLYMPGLLFQKKLLAETDGKPSNSFFVVAPSQVSLLFPAATANDVVGVCKFDLGAGKLVLTAQLPRSYWTLSIYTQSGRQIYSLDDVQAGSNSFTVDLSTAKTVWQQVFSKNETDDGGQIENLGWKVETTERRGIAVVWIPLADPLMRANIENTIMASKCRPKAATD
jgi:uncharacterized membrane protein